MTSPAKCFFSHKSVNKDFLQEVVKQLPETRLEIDSLTFEFGKTSSDEILNSIYRSQLFVLLATKEALESEWIQGEIETAKQQYFKKQIKGILVFILEEDLPIKSIGNWLRTFVVVKTKNPTRIANLIKSKLVQIDASNNFLLRPYVHRHNLSLELEKKLANLTNPTRAIYVSGVEGIGRKSLVTKVLSTISQNSDTLGITLPLFDGEGMLEAYRKLYQQWNNPSANELSLLFDETTALSRDELKEAFIGLINEIGSARSYVWMQFDSSAVNDDGEIESQFQEILKSLDTNRPTLIIRAKKLPKFPAQRRTPNVAYLKVTSLTNEESRLLWIYALQHFQVSQVDEQLISYLLEHISGHPNLIWLAAEYVSQVGIGAIKTNINGFTEELSKLSMSLIDGLELSPNAKNVLALFDEFTTISLEDIQVIFKETNDEDNFNESITHLITYGLLEFDETHFSIAPYFQHTRFRKVFSIEVDPFLKQARNSLLEMVNEYDGHDSISFSTIDSVIISSIKDGKEIPLGFGDRAILGSHFLRVARSFFDKKNYNLTIKYAKLAYQKDYTLSENARIEVLRLLAISSIRVADNTDKEFALQMLSKINTTQANKHIAFIKGFDARWNGNYDVAEQHFKEVITFNANDLHALRELSQILTNREDYKSAELIVRRALNIASGNPYLIDILLQCLIQLKRNDLNTLRHDEEIQDLFSRLSIADSREKSSFHPLRHAQYLAALKMYNGALIDADKAVSAGIQLIAALTTRAEIKMAMENDKSIQASAFEDIKKIEQNVNGKRYTSLLSKLKIRFELCLSNHTEAIRLYETNSMHLGKFRRVLGLEIANSIVDKKVSDRSLIVWANHFLSSSVPTN